MNPLGELSAKLTLDNSKYMSSMSAASASTSSFQGKLVSATASLSRLAMTVTTAAATAFVGLSTVIIRNTSELEQNTVAFEAMLGSAEKAATLLQTLAKFAKETPFELADLQAYTKQLLAYGFSMDELIPTLTTVGNISAGLGKDSLPILIRALGQIRAKGKLAGQEFLQLTETGLPIADQLAKTLGISVQELTGNIANLDISYEDVLSTIKNIEKNQFKDLMVKQSKTLKGIWSNIKDTFTQTTWQIGTQSGLFDKVKGIAQSILDKFTQLMPVIVEVSTNLVKGIIEKLKEFSESDIFKSLVNLFTTIKNYVVDRLIPAFQEISKEGGFDELTDKVGNIIDDITRMFKLLTGSDKDDAKSGLQSLVDVITTFATLVDYTLVGLTAMASTLTTIASFFGSEAATKLTQVSQRKIVGPVPLPSTLLKTQTQKTVDAITSTPTSTSGYQGIASRYGLKASGGLASGDTIVGEQGVEALKLPSGTRVYNNRETKNMLKDEGKRGVTVNNTFNVGNGISMAVLSRNLNWMYRKLI